VEEFRHPIIDRLTLNLFNNELLTQDDFRPVAENGVYLTAEGIKQYFQFYEQRLKAPFQNSKADNFRTVMKQQVLKMAQSIQNRQPYKPFKRLE
jgi:CRISPR-associated protein Cas1